MVKGHTVSGVDAVNAMNGIDGIDGTTPMVQGLHSVHHGDRHPVHSAVDGIKSMETKPTVSGQSVMASDPKVLSTADSGYSMKRNMAMESAPSVHHRPRPMVRTKELRDDDGLNMFEADRVRRARCGIQSVETPSERSLEVLPPSASPVAVAMGSVIEAMGHLAVSPEAERDSKRNDDAQKKGASNGVMHGMKGQNASDCGYGVEAVCGVEAVDELDGDQRNGRKQRKEGDESKFESNGIHKKEGFKEQGLRRIKGTKSRISSDDKRPKVECKEMNEEKLESEGQTASQREFMGYLKRLDLSQYAASFAGHGLADMRYLSVLEANDLVRDIGMSTVHVKYFMAKQAEWKRKREEFRRWMAGIQLFSEYHELLEMHGIFEFESFYRIVRRVEDLHAIMGADNEFDAELIWKSSPKQARKLQLQPEGMAVQ